MRDCLSTCSPEFTVFVSTWPAYVKPVAAHPARQLERPARVAGAGAAPVTMAPPGKSSLDVAVGVTPGAERRPQGAAGAELKADVIDRSLENAVFTVDPLAGTYNKLLADGVRALNEVSGRFRFRRIK